MDDRLKLEAISICEDASDLNSALLKSRFVFLFENSGLSLVDLAAYIGASKGNISTWIGGNSAPSKIAWTTLRILFLEIFIYGKVKNRILLSNFAKNRYKNE